MTKLLCLEDSYLKEFKSKVVSSNGDQVILDQTAFYPRGGGQPCDTGMLSSTKGENRVVEVYKDGGNVIHKVTAAGLGSGDELTGLIEWSQRYAYMRHHTAIHVLSGIISKLYGANVTGGQIYADRARVDFDLEDSNSDRVSAIQESANKTIGEGHSVAWRMIPREEALKIPDLVRTKPGLELVQRLDHIRVVEIVGFDIQADGGTHVRNTNEIGRIEVVKVENKGKHNKRLEFVLSKS